jgi:LacI family transcriptional regulator, gluconate utilization system Gnt-I transcriptional repressor
VPNKIAGALASQRVNLVGVVIPSLSNMVFPEVLGGVSAALEDSGLQPVFGATDYKAEREENVIYEMLSWRPSGMIVAGLEHTEAARAMLANSGIPIVEIMDIDGDPVDSMVGISHRRAGARWRRRSWRPVTQIGFLGSKMPDDHRARKRLEGFTEALKEAGQDLTEEEHYAGGSSMAKGREMTESILATA